MKNHKQPVTRSVDNDEALSTDGFGAQQWKTLRGFPRYESLWLCL
ncbi:hypothetical protein [Pseudomonas oryzihabitans]|nr:hypothetical protein [Pseudomonas psychrotolerans]MDR6677159.1 hypothetical protein [Pseudomonas psychrotolerans]